MLNYGFIRIASATPSVNVANCDYNTQSILDLTVEAYQQGAEIILFPELSVTSCSCADLFYQTALLEKTTECLIKIREFSKTLKDLLIIAGAPLKNNNKLYNCAVAIQNGEIVAIYPKSKISSNEELRWFTPASFCKKEYIEIDDEQIPFSPYIIINKGTAKIAVVLGDDYKAQIPQSSLMAVAGANIILNMSASEEISGIYQNLKNNISEISARTNTSYIYSSAGYGESTTDLVYAGNCILAENGNIINEAIRFSLQPQLVINDIDVELLENLKVKENTIQDNTSNIAVENVYLDTREYNDEISLLRSINKNPFIPTNQKEENTFNDIFEIQAAGLIKRLDVTHSKNIVIGISGGLDSTLALLVAVSAFDKLGLDRKGVHGITMPGFGTTDRTYTNALTLMKVLGITIKEIPIREAVIQHFKDIEHDINNRDVTYENSQARERTQILMDYANKVSGMVLGTGDLSELALGWATYNGDHMSMYGVNASVPKTLMQHIIRWYAHNQNDNLLRTTLLDIVDTPISPELIPANENGEIKQKTEDLVGPYELHDFFLYNMLKYNFAPSKIYYLAQNAFNREYDSEAIKKWLKTFYRRFFTQQFKRSCLPDGPKATEISLSPRCGLRMPSDASYSLWAQECENL